MRIKSELRLLRINSTYFSCLLRWDATFTAINIKKEHCRLSPSLKGGAPLACNNQTSGIELGRYEIDRATRTPQSPHLPRVHGCAYSCTRRTVGVVKTPRRASSPFSLAYADIGFHRPAHSFGGRLFDAFLRNSIDLNNQNNCAIHLI